jgi:hypothetical protein
MKAPFFITVLLVAGLTFTYCKKDDPKPDPAPTPAPTPTPGPPPFTKGFKKQDQTGRSFISDSAKCKPNATIHQITSYRGALQGDAIDDVEITIMHPPLRQITYPVDSIDISTSRFQFDGFSDTYKPTAGQLVISALNGSVASGNFQFTVVPSSQYMSSTLTVFSATFIDIPVRN